MSTPLLGVTMDDFVRIVYSFARSAFINEEPDEIKIVMRCGKIRTLAIPTGGIGNLPGDGPDHVLMEFTERQHAVIGQMAGAARGNNLHPCAANILATLRDIPEPLTFTRLMEEMERRKFIWGETTIKRFVGQLMEDGTIENPPGARPRGYRLPERDT